MKKNCSYGTGIEMNIKNTKQIVVCFKELKENETGISQVPDHIYNSINDNLNDRLCNPVVIEILEQPNRSVNKISTEVH